MRHTARSKPELHRWLELLSPTDRRVMAQLWGALSGDPTTLAAWMTNPQHVAAQWQRLNDLERAALTRLLQDSGAVPVAIVQREFGGVREPGGFEHPRAYLEALTGPATPTERLFSMGLIFKSHDERGAIYRIPNDLLPLLPDVPPRDRRLHVTPGAAPGRIDANESGEELIVALLELAYWGSLKTIEEGALNKASLVKLAQHTASGLEGRTIRREQDWPFVAVIRAAVVEAGLLRRTSDGELRPTPPALDWLKAPQAERARRLLDGWCASTIDELTLLCNLRWKGGAPYTLNRTATRRNLLRLLGTLPTATWLPVTAVINAIQRVEPDFQRRDGRYDTWLLYTSDERLVSSWADWELVEGALVREIVRGPLHWLRLVELGDSGNLVRITALGAHLLTDAPAPSEPPATPLIVQSTFEAICPPGVALFARFQLSRFAELQQAGVVSLYRLTRAALLAATERGIDAEDVLRFLEDQSAGPLPENVAYSLREWGGQANQVRLEHAVLLHTADPVVMARLRRLKDVGLDLIEPLAPTLLRVPDGLDDELADRLRRAGFGLRDERINPQLPIDERELRALVAAALVYARICTELDLPCDISPPMLQRLLKLVPPRAVETARQSAETIAQRIAQPQTAHLDERTSGAEPV